MINESLALHFTRYQSLSTVKRWYLMILVIPICRSLLTPPVTTTNFLFGHKHLPLRVQAHPVIWNATLVTQFHPPTFSSLPHQQCPKSGVKNVGITPPTPCGKFHGNAFGPAGYTWMIYQDLYKNDDRVQAIPPQHPSIHSAVLHSCLQCNLQGSSGKGSIWGSIFSLGLQLQLTRIS